MYSLINRRSQTISECHQSGISLIEVLVATVIIGIALLGMMQLQITSLQANQDAYSRSVASVLAQDILERMRVNNDDSNAITQYFNSSGNNTGSNQNCVVYSGSTKPNCTSAQIAQNDLFEWNQLLATQLPQASGLVCRSDLLGDIPGTPDCDADTNENNPVVVYIWWTQGRSANQNILQLSVSSEI